MAMDLPPVLQCSALCIGVSHHAPALVLTRLRKAIGAGLRGDTEAAKLALVGHLSAQGMLQMYVMFLEYSKPAVRSILELFTEPANYPIHIYCTLGKDRTGCIVALLLWCCGATREEIVRDYERSRHVVRATCVL
jgi:hypothetical protein